jgi:hypothetical protein
LLNKFWPIIFLSQKLLETGILLCALFSLLSPLDNAVSRPFSRCNDQHFKRCFVANRVTKSCHRVLNGWGGNSRYIHESVKTFM